jgi:hypothetical protein
VELNGQPTSPSILTQALSGNTLDFFITTNQLMNFYHFFVSYSVINNFGVTGTPTTFANTPSVTVVSNNNRDFSSTNGSGAALKLYSVNQDNVASSFSSLAVSNCGQQ